MNTMEDEVNRGHSDVLVKELEVYSSEIVDRHQQTSHYFKLYALVASGFLAVSAFGAQVLQSDDRGLKIGYAFFWLAAWLIALFAGWCFTHFLGHNYRGIILARKNLAEIRNTIHQTFRTCKIPFAYCSGARADDIEVSGSMRDAHYWFLVANSLVALTLFPAMGRLFDELQLEDPWTRTLHLGTGIISILALMYPKVCASYHRQIRIADATSPTLDETKAKAEYDRLAKHKDLRWARRRFLTYSIAMLILVWFFVSLDAFCPLRSSELFRGWSWAYLPACLMILIFSRIVALRMRLARRRKKKANLANVESASPQET